MEQDWKITLHWTAGTNTASDLDKQHYHYIVDADGTISSGVHTPEDNKNCSDGNYAAHVLNCNNYNIGVAMAGMYGAVESPLYVGKYPITKTQMQAAATLVAKLADKYGVPVEPTRILTHAEIQPNLGVRQKGKWDVTVLPWDGTVTGHAAVGNYFRSLVAEALIDGTGGVSTVAPAATAGNRPLLYRGIASATTHVKYLQKRLIELGLLTGSADGVFGKLTERAVEAFQSRHDLDTDGKVGRATWAALEAAS